MTASQIVRMRMHPRVFESLGSDLVTSDYVAITELVKNAYDAFAKRVDIRFVTDSEHGPYMEILDDGNGMSRSTVENVWCVVATPYRKDIPVSRKGKKIRRVSGEKGLGRLSVARLGDRLQMTTRAKDDACLQVDVAWSDLSHADDLSGCTVTLTEVQNDDAMPESGTRLRILDLKSEWTDDRLEELKDHLSRLLSPFSEVDDFKIWLHPSSDESEAAQIEVPQFLHRPKYRLTGDFTNKGELIVKYQFEPVGSKKKERSEKAKMDWEQIRELTRLRRLKEAVSPTCGPFEFEIRAWDIAVSDVGEISEQFEMQKSLVRPAIRAHKGISVYRDGILVLPKSESARDWLGLDLRRVSELGTRLSTSQIIGYVAITAEKNPKIRDTSDRERLVQCPEVAIFEEVIRIAVSLLEGERLKDRLVRESAEPTFQDLFGKLSVEPLREKMEEVVRRDGTAKEAMPLIKGFEEGVKKTVDEIERRFIYYSRLATIGTLAQMLVHEVRNKTTVVSSYLEQIMKLPSYTDFSSKLRERHERATNAVSALDRLAETFLPLASRSFGRGKRFSVLEERISTVLAVLDQSIKQAGIDVRFRATGSTAVAIDPGELDAILLNLLDNAVFWLSRTPKGERILELHVKRVKSGERVKVSVHDSGPGVPEEDAERIFWPGVTKKPGGIGMGLTIASEIVDAHDGKMALVQPGLRNGASFEFDLPVKSA